jgi:hypothetical protein
MVREKNQQLFFNLALSHKDNDFMDVIRALSVLEKARAITGVDQKEIFLFDSVHFQDLCRVVVENSKSLYLAQGVKKIWQAGILINHHNQSLYGVALYALLNSPDKRNIIDALLEACREGHVSTEFFYQHLVLKQQAERDLYLMDKSQQEKERYSRDFFHFSRIAHHPSPRDFVKFLKLLYQLDFTEMDIHEMYSQIAAMPNLAHIILTIEQFKYLGRTDINKDLCKHLFCVINESANKREVVPALLEAILENIITADFIVGSREEIQYPIIKLCYDAIINAAKPRSVVSLIKEIKNLDIDFAVQVSLVEALNNGFEDVVRSELENLKKIKEVKFVPGVGYSHVSDSTPQKGAGMPVSNGLEHSENHCSSAQEAVPLPQVEIPPVAARHEENVKVHRRSRSRSRERDEREIAKVLVTMSFLNDSRSKREVKPRGPKGGETTVVPVCLSGRSR